MDLRKENPLPQFNVASYERPGLKLAFEDTKIQCDTTSRIFFLEGGGGGARQQVLRLRCLEKCFPSMQFNQEFCPTLQNTVWFNDLVSTSL